MTSTTLAVDFGSKHIGVALVEHSRDCPNRVLYAATLTVAAKPLKDLVEPRAMARRIRRTRKTHRRRLQRLAQSLSDVRGADAILRFCRRRGFSYDSGEEQDEQSFHISREEFFAAIPDVSVAPSAVFPDKENILRMEEGIRNDASNSENSEFSISSFDFPFTDSEEGILDSESESRKRDREKKGKNGKRKGRTGRDGKRREQKGMEGKGRERKGKVGK